MARIAAFRENPARAIYVVGEINQAMVDRLTPQILTLQQTSSEPITVYIDSPGGGTYYAQLILNLLKNHDQDNRHCQIITVVTGLAASAAADILASGDYAIAYRHATIHFHGVRTSRGDAITHESASSLAEALRQTNEGYALDLARQVLGRFMFVYMQLESDFPSVRRSEANWSDVECLAECMTQKLGGFSELLQLAVRKHNQTHALLEYYSGELAAKKEVFARPALREAILLKCLIDWELGRNDAQDWRFSSEGLAAISEDFILLVDYEDGKHMSDLEQLSRQWGSFLLDVDLRAGYDRTPDDQRAAYVSLHTKERFREVWHFLVSVCRALQQGENRLSSRDAYWLGLINEIPGTTFSSIRELIEQQDEVPMAPLPKPKRQPRKGTKMLAKKLK